MHKIIATIAVTGILILSHAAFAQGPKPRPTAPVSSPSVQISPNTKGLTSLKYNGTEFLYNGAFTASVEFQDSGENISTGNSAHTSFFDSRSNTLTQSYPWGRITCRYTPAGSRLKLTITISNTSSQTLSAFNFVPLQLRFPSRPAQYDGKSPILWHNIGGPTVLPMNYLGGVLALVNEDVTQPLMVGFPWAMDGKNSRIYPLQINTGRNAMYPSSMPEIIEPIAPGRTDTITLSLRFGRASSNTTDLAGDIYDAYRKAFPFKLDWPDRRGIGMLMLAQSPDALGGNGQANPRGWFSKAGWVNINTPSGVTAFQTYLLAYADNAVQILKNSNAQGMIVWDLEGEEMPQPITYIGDPRMVGTLAPEMKGAVDAFFKKFTDAGLKVGITIRPQQLKASGSGYDQVEVAEPGQLLIDKITYAKNRWGCTIFYVDSNGDPSLPTDASFIAKVQARFPDVLLIPESDNPQYHAYSAPYTELRSGRDGTPQNVRELYPQAFEVVNVSDGNLNDPQLVSSVKRGDILMYRAWFNDDAIPKVEAIYNSAGTGRR